MTLTEHVVLGGAAALVLSPALGTEGSLAFWASSVLLDVDHYWDYLVKTGFRNWSPRTMFAYYRELAVHLRRPDMLILSLFHTAEWFLLVGLLGLWGGVDLVVAAFCGMVFHLALDLVRLASYRAVSRRALSIVEYVIRRRRLWRRGVDPDAVFREALVAVGVTPAADLVGASAREAST